MKDDFTDLKEHFTDVSELFLNEKAWLRQKFSRLPIKTRVEKIHEWATKRYLSKTVTGHPGYWSADYVPFFTEILDALMPDSGIEEVTLMKPEQIGGTVSVLENWMGFIIDKAPAPTLYLTANEKVAKISMQVYLNRMIESAGLNEKITAYASEKKGKGSGQTINRIDFAGGFILLYGGLTESALSRYSVKNIAVDEVGLLSTHASFDPITLARGRQKGFEETRKALFIGLPTIPRAGIHALFLEGDQRYYFVPCPFCGRRQILVFRGVRKDRKKFGIYFEMENGSLLTESVGYKCRYCLKLIGHEYKYQMLNAGRWRATSKPLRPRRRSYHLEALYAPEGNISWVEYVYQFLDWWDVERKISKNLQKQKTFSRNTQAQPFEERTEAPALEVIRSRRRQMYTRGEIPNRTAEKETGSRILVLTMAVDVHKRWMGAEIKGWCENGCSYSIDYKILEGDCRDVNDASWQRLLDLIQNRIFIADDGRNYRITLTLIDAGYSTDTVYSFCRTAGIGVFPIMGLESAVGGSIMEGFKEYTKKNLTAYNINTKRYKDRLAANLRKDWKDQQLQPPGYVNFPADYGDDLFAEYENEHLVKKTYKSGKFNYVWVLKDANLPNHFWDVGVYNEAAIEMLCYFTYLEIFEKEDVNFEWFWQFLKEEEIYIMEFNDE